MKKTVILFCILILATFQSNFIDSKNSDLNQENTGLLELENHRIIEINVILFNYVEDQIFQNSLNNKLKSDYSIVNGYETYDYNIIFNYIYPDQLITDEFNNFITNSASTPNSKTVDINQTALKYQAVNNTVQEIFYEITGTAIDGLAVEDWLWNKYNSFESDNTSYQIFLLNLTYLDDFFWFEIPEIDEASSLQRTWWRLEWDYPITASVNNYDVKFPYSGYSNRYPLYFLDPSSFNWYLNWTRIWRNINDDFSHRHYKNTFKSYIDNLGGFSSDINKEKAGTYIGDWLNEIVSNTILLNPIGRVSIPKSLDIQLAIFTDETGSNNYPDVSWVINKSLIEKKLNYLIPQTQISIKSQFYRLEDQNEVKSLLNSHVVSPFSSNNEPIKNYTYYDGFNLFSPMINYDGLYFNATNAERTIKGYIFIMDNSSFVGANWNGGGLYTGLGGGGRLLILNEVDRLFFNRTTDPVRKESISKVLVHEAGHAISLPHPFKSDLSSQYASDFIGEVMGYYSSTSDFSYLFKVNFQRLNIESRIDSMLNQLVNLSSEEIDYAKSVYQSLLKSYRKFDFNGLNNSLNQLDLIKNSEITLENPPTPPKLLSIPINDGSIYRNSYNLFIWEVYDKNPFYYEIFVNDTLMKTGTWNNSDGVLFNFYAESIGTYNVTLVVYDSYYLNNSNSIFIFVINKTSESSKTSNPVTTPFSFNYFVFFIALYVIKKRKSKTD